MPYGSAGRSAANKLRALLPPATAAGTEHLLTLLRVQVSPAVVEPRVLAALEHAVADGTAVRLRYADRHGTETARTVEPAGSYGTPGGWHVAAWCRLRDEGRLFRLDRIHAVHQTREPVQQRDLDVVLGWLPTPAVAPE